MLYWFLPKIWCYFKWDGIFFFFFCSLFLIVNYCIVYRKETSFCILILYLANVPNSFFSSSSFFLVETLTFFIFSIIPFANNDSFTSFLTIWMPFISFPCLIAVSRTPSTMLNRSDKRWMKLEPIIQSEVKVLITFFLGSRYFKMFNHWHCVVVSKGYSLVVEHGLWGHAGSVVKAPRFSNNGSWA